jgi:hypothetical protein
MAIEFERGHATLELSNRLVLALLFLLLSSTAHAVGTLSGTVVDAADGSTPVHPVYISLIDPITGEFTPGLATFNQPDGSYEISSIQPGDWKVLFESEESANAYRDELYDGIECNNATCDVVALGDVFIINEGSNVLDVDLELGASLSGSVVDAADGTTPVHPVYITLIDPVTGEFPPRLDTFNQADGSYRIGGIPPGDWKIFFEAVDAADAYGDELYDGIACDGGDCDFSSLGDTLNLSQGENTLDVDLERDPPISNLGECGSGDLITRGSFEDPPGYTIRFDSDATAIFTSSGQQADFSVVFENAEGQAMSTAGLEWCLDDETHLDVSVSGPTATIGSTGFELGSVGVVVRDPATNTIGRGLVMFADMAPNTSYVSSASVVEIAPDQVILSRDAETEAIQVGDIIVSGSQTGILVTVLGVTLTADQVILTVEPAALTDAFENLAINLDTEEQAAAAQFLLPANIVDSLNGAVAQDSAGLDELQCVEQAGREYAVSVVEPGSIDWQVSNQFSVQLQISDFSWRVFSIRATQQLELLSTGGKVAFSSINSSPPTDPVVCFVELERQFSQVEEVPGWDFQFLTKPRVGLKFTNRTLNADFTEISVPIGRLTGTASEGVLYTSSVGWEKLGNVESDASNVALGHGIFEPVADSNRPAPDPYQNYDIEVSAFGALDFDLFVSRNTGPAVTAARTAVARNSSAGQSVRASLEDEAEKNGKVSVIVGLDVSFQPEGRMKASGVASQRAAIQALQSDLLNRLPVAGVAVKARYRFIPFMALRVDANALQGLYRSPLVSSVQPDHVAEANLVSSNPVIGSPTAWEEELEGVDQTVAILDTGVDIAHPWFTTGGNKIVSEACYSTDDEERDSLCPGGVEASTAPGSGDYCFFEYGCDHGTHVAGIVAGNDGTGPNFGVARGADIVAMQVFYKITGCIPTPQESCLRTQASDRIQALERVLEIAASHNIVAVNMSLGGGRYYDQASCDSSNAAEKAAIDNLRSAGIATIISSGNDDYLDSIGAPGCISSAISVGATTDGDDPPADRVADFSNIYSDIHLLAPGVTIHSAVPEGGVIQKMELPWPPHTWREPGLSCKVRSPGQPYRRFSMHCRVPASASMTSALGDSCATFPGSIYRRR